MDTDADVAKVGSEVENGMVVNEDIMNVAKGEEEMVEIPCLSPTSNRNSLSKAVGRIKANDRKYKGQFTTAAVEEEKNKKVGEYC